MALKGDPIIHRKPPLRDPVLIIKSTKFTFESEIPTDDGILLFETGYDGT